MKTMKKKYRLTNQAKLKVVCDSLCDNIELLLDHLELEYDFKDKMVTMCCPIHGGDNPSALNLYHQGDNYRGNWVCRTHHCEKVFKSSVIGFVRGVISNNKYGWSKEGDNFCSFDEAVEFCLSVINQDMKNIKVNKSQIEKKTFAAIISKVKNHTKEIIANKITKSQVRQSLSYPCDYFLSRGFSNAILDKYDVGTCIRVGKEMYERCVVPIYDQDNKYLVGCSGRSIFEKCTNCACYHNPKDECPDEDGKWKYPKWKHSNSFKSQNHLYNFWFAKNHILNLSTVVLVESPGNVWRLEEAGIHNSVAMFGCSLSDRQKILIDSSGAMNIIILTDNDAAGQLAAKEIKNKCSNTYNIYQPTFDRNDIACMSIQEVKDLINPIMDKIL